MNKTHTLSSDGAPRSDAPIDASDPLRFLTRLAGRGDVVPYDTAYGSVYLINRPELVRHVLQSDNYVRGSMMKMVLGEGLLASEGDYWRRQRQLMQPAFHAQRIAAMGTLMTQAAVETMAGWQKYAGSGRPIDIQTEMVHLTLKIIGKALFNIDFHDELDAVAEAVKTMVADLGRFAGTLFAKTYPVDAERNRRFDAALQTVDDLVHRVIDERRRNSETVGDLFSVLLSHRDKQSGKALNDRQVRDEVVTMLLAGHVTTANMLTWAWYLLSEHRAIEAELHRELSRALGGRLPAARDIPALPYTRMVLQETLRLYPPVWFMSRGAVADDEVGGYQIPANATIVISPYLVHRHPAYWTNPEQFNPERFAPEDMADRPSFAYLPFAAGHHVCIGNHLALLEGQLVLATIAQKYKLRLAPGAVVEPEPALTLRVRDRLPMILEDASRAGTAEGRTTTGPRSDHEEL
jgi:cytochrome P450